MTTRISPLFLDRSERENLWQQVIRAIECYFDDLPKLSVTCGISQAGAARFVSAVDFERPLPPAEAVRFAVEGLRNFGVQTPHPRYFGLFNPAPTTIGIAAETLVAAFNPQTGAWGHHPFGVQLERSLLRAFSAKFGYDPGLADGILTVGGSEGNHTAIATALASAFPEIEKGGLRSLRGQPTVYASTESHHSLHKAVRLCGLGANALRAVPVDEYLRMDPNRLSEAIRKDRAAGSLPFLIVATAGTTNAGVVDPLAEIAAVAAQEANWLHVDAAWGGAAALVPELRYILSGIQQADSIIFDTHKWLSVPLTAGFFLTRHPGVMSRTFHVEPSYVPRDGSDDGVVDFYAHSMQWGRHFLGLKVFLSLAVASWKGYEETLRHMTRMGDLLRRKLGADGWKILNRTPLPLVCFNDGYRSDGGSSSYLEAIASALVASGQAWISTTRLGEVVPALRACVTSFHTNEDDLTALVDALNAARKQFAR
jgi:glutamate/tyrosine decarboxylase-like PLP-dependent enzyme